MDSVHITVVKPFTPPIYGAGVVVFSPDKDYLEKEDSMQHLLDAIKYSKRHRCYTVSCPFLKEREIMLCLISPEGDIIASQSATHIHLNNRRNVHHSSEITVIKTPIANFFLAAGTDIFHPEVIRTAAAMGAEIVISSRYMYQIDDLCYRVCVGAENMATSNGLYIVDVTEEGGRFIDPWAEPRCIRLHKASGELGKKWEADLNRLRCDPMRPILFVDQPFYQQYREILER